MCGTSTIFSEFVVMKKMQDWKNRKEKEGKLWRWVVILLLYATKVQCAVQKIPIPPLPSPLWKLKLNFIHYFNFLGSNRNPPHPKEIPLPSVRGGGMDISWNMQKKLYEMLLVSFIKLKLWTVFRSKRPEQPYYVIVLPESNSKVEHPMTKQLLHLITNHNILICLLTLKRRYRTQDMDSLMTFFFYNDTICVQDKRRVCVQKLAEVWYVTW